MSVKNKYLDVTVKTARVLVTAVYWLFTSISLSSSNMFRLTEYRVHETSILLHVF